MEDTESTSLDLAGRFQRHPYQGLLIAAGVGYVLGGGLFSKLTLRALGVGLRMGALPLLRRELVSAAEAALGTRSHSST